jgi:glycosyltransferase involved in cell wall biosynthesis
MLPVNQPPAVSIIVPCYNEQDTIRQLLEAVAVQTYPLQYIEMIIADGLSTDRTRQEIARYQESRPDLDIKIVDNVKRTIPAGLNTAIRTARGEFLVRMDAHSSPYPDYVQRCLDALLAGKAENVGGVWEIQPGGPGWIPFSIATAAAHPLGVGDAHYRLGGKPRYVDTVPFGSYRRSLVENLGYFDETLLTNEDYEFNARIRASGGRVWLDPAIRANYYARSTLEELARQYVRYGYWKGNMLRRYPKTLRWRQLLPPLFVASLIGLGILSLFFSSAVGLLLGILTAYTLVLLLAGMQTALKKRQLSLIIGFPLAVAIMHTSWGSALLWSLLSRSGHQGKQ